MKRFLLLMLLLSYAPVFAQTLGLITKTSGARDGYVLFAPNSSTFTYLIDKCGYVVHTWNSAQVPGQSVYLLEDGTLLRTGRTGNTVFNSGGNGGMFEKCDWNSNVLWSYTISSPTECQHHDIRVLPNGNVLAIVWELKSQAEAIAAGRNPALLGTSLWSEKIIEVQQTGLNSGAIVWEWHAWDHLIQDYDSTKANYGVVADHPELLNLNYANGAGSDWLHCNALDYNDSLDQIILSSHNTCEFWIIDHSTTVAEAASHSGGIYARGGDLLYRWGNPAVYDRGTTADKKLFGQHNPQWIKSGLPDAGNILVFNNGLQRPGGNYSSVEMLELPITINGDYSIIPGQPYLPVSPYWTYTAAVPATFYSQNISGAHRLSNGNTMICDGPKGNFFEIDTAGATVWKYISPVSAMGNILSQGAIPTQNSVFRCTHYDVSYPGFAGHSLAPGAPLELNPLPSSCNMTTGLDGLNAESISFTAVNPFHDQLQIISSATIKDAEVALLDLNGRMVDRWMHQDFMAGQQVGLLPSNLPGNGCYLLNVKNEKTSKTIKLLRVD